jgi:ribonucleoside-diphosphate reductase alpha chain
MKKNAGKEPSPVLPPISKMIWDMKYRYRREDVVVDQTVEDTWHRVAKAVAAREKNVAEWEKKFYHLLEDFRFLPGGRILANAGTGRQQTTMFNCYVMGTIQDSIEGIFQTVKEAAQTQKQGGGVGFDFSTIRPRGSFIKGVDSPASGPMSFMQVLDATCKTIMSAGQRRGAQMGIMRCDHPDIEAFIAAKREEGMLRMFNLSVAVTDEFLAAVEKDADWPLVHGGKTWNTVKAKELWEKIMRSTYDFAEPGIFMVDRVNAMNNLWYCEKIAATNPCAEQPLPPYGACLLGSLNLTRFVKNPFAAAATFDFEALEKHAKLAVRFLDNVIELSNFPLPQQAEEAKQKRRMGIGLTGLADTLVFLGMRYGSPESLAFAEDAMRTITLAAYEASADLASEKGAFPMLDTEKYLEGKFAAKLPASLRAKIRKQGLRNSHLTSIAPTGTISLLAGNISSGIEPIFAYHYIRKVREGQETETREHEVMDYAYAEYCRLAGRPSDDSGLPPAFIHADAVTPDQHLDMQAALQKYVDSSISKTINVPTDFPFEAFKDIYLKAYRKGLKGCTTFRPSEFITGVLVKKDDKKHGKGKHPATTTPDRPIELVGTTYKVRTPASKDAFYVTINDIEENGQRRPYEIFINTKNLQHFSWIVAMTRTISAIFRREPNPSFLVEELSSVYDPAGGYFNDGEYVPSLPAEIGRVIATHLRGLGIMPENGRHGKKHGAHDAHLAEEIKTAEEKAGAGAGFCPACTTSPRSVAARLTAIRSPALISAR